MRNVRKNIATRQVIHIVGEGLTELFYFSHLKKFLGYTYWTMKRRRGRISNRCGRKP